MAAIGLVTTFFIFIHLYLLADALTRARESYTVTVGVRSDSFCAAIWRMATAT